MQAVELEATIVDHAITIHSNRLPAHAARAKVIVLIEETASGEPAPRSDVSLADVLAHPFKVSSFQPLSREAANAR
jgi:hypothetical protein